MGEWQCRRLWFPGIASGIVGVVFLAIGLVLAVQANTYDPASDFVSVSGGCVVVAVREYDTYNNHISSPRATWRRFAYDISIVNTTSVLDGGIVDSRLIGQTCDAPPFSRATCGTPFNVSEIRPCWRRAPGVELEYLRGLYSCGEGNEECVTLSDPEGVYHGTTDYKTGWITIGVVEIVLFLVVMPFLVTDCRRSCGSRNPPRHGEVAFEHSVERARPPRSEETRLEMVTVSPEAAGATPVATVTPVSVSSV